MQLGSSQIRWPWLVRDAPKIAFARPRKGVTVFTSAAPSSSGTHLLKDQRMSVQLDRDSGDSLIQVTGDFDGRVGDKVAEAIDHCRRVDSSVTVDLSQVSSISLSGVSRLLDASQDGTAEDVSYVFEDKTEELMELLILWWNGAARRPSPWVGRRQRPDRVWKGLDHFLDNPPNLETRT